MVIEGFSKRKVIHRFVLGKHKNHIDSKNSSL
jgi:hypothetical protein